MTGRTRGACSYRRRACRGLSHRSEASGRRERGCRTRGRRRTRPSRIAAGRRWRHLWSRQRTWRRATASWLARVAHVETVVVHGLKRAAHRHCPLWRLLAGALLRVSTISPGASPRSQVANSGARTGRSGAPANGRSPTFPSVCARLANARPRAVSAMPITARRRDTPCRRRLAPTASSGDGHRGKVFPEGPDRSRRCQRYRRR
jgi:hypothetical protein